MSIADLEQRILACGSIKDAIFDSVRAREVVVVDGKGVMLYDEEGIERGGYVTQDVGSNVMLTLDAKIPPGRAVRGRPRREPGQRTGPVEQGRRHRDALGWQRPAPERHQQIRRRDAQPAITTLSAATCASYKDIEKKFPGERSCQARFTDAACQACFDSP